MSHIPLGGGREFDRIRAIAGALGARAAGLGDDCAFLPCGTQMLAVSTDVSAEGRHFRLEWLDLGEIGWRAAASALSDLAAVGAEPAGVIAAVTVPEPAGDRELTTVMHGVGEAARAAGTAVIGGDLVAGNGWSLAVTVLGWVRRPLRRSEARAGDGVWVTGTLGGARVALDAWRHGGLPPAAARAAFARPTPRIAAGCWLATAGATAAIDLSDGLGGDAAHLAAASRVALHLDLEQVPVAPDAIAAAERAGVPVQQYAAEGGEDYELLVTLPPAFGDGDARRFERECGLALTRIGSVRTGAGVHIRLAGRPVALRGFNHFA